MSLRDPTQRNLGLEVMDCQLVIFLTIQFKTLNFSDIHCLLLDPRDWTRTDVWTWLTTLARSEGLEISNELADKFPMNGKALCLMSLEMYLNRVPIGGKMLYRDFRVRLARAMALYSNN